MAGSLAYLNICGLEPDGVECFQGRGTTSTSSGSGEALAFDWGTVPAEVVELLQDYYTRQQDWISNLEALGDEQEQAASAANSRGLRELPAVLENAPMIPILLTTLATGGASVPVVLGEILIQVGLSVADAELRNVFDRLNPNSPENQLKALVAAIQDLKYNDEVVDLGNVRIHHKGKVIEY